MIHWRGAFGEGGGAFGEGGEEPSGVPPFRTVISSAALSPGKRQGGAFGSAGGLPGVPPFRTVISPADPLGEAASRRFRQCRGLPGVPPFRTVILPAAPLGEAASRRFRQRRGRHRLCRRSAP